MYSKFTFKEKFNASSNKEKVNLSSAGIYAGAINNDQKRKCQLQSHTSLDITTDH